MPPPDSNALIAAWERGRDRHALDRGLTLFALAVPELDPDTLADRPLSERNIALLRLRSALFGDALALCVDCPQCSERLEFRLSAEALIGPTRASADTFELDGHRFRRPTTRDLAQAAEARDKKTAIETLVRAMAEPG